MRYKKSFVSIIINMPNTRRSRFKYETAPFPSWMLCKYFPRYLIINHKAVIKRAMCEMLAISKRNDRWRQYGLGRLTFLPGCILHSDWMQFGAYSTSTMHLPITSSHFVDKYLHDEMAPSWTCVVLSVDHFDFRHYPFCLAWIFIGESSHIGAKYPYFQK